jgi:putative oxidoreductase
VNTAASKAPEGSERRADKREWLARLARFALAAVFIGAAVPKLLAPGEFAAAIENYRVLPQALVGKVAMILPVGELVLAAALIVGPMRRGAALLCTLLLVGFSVAMAQARMRGIDLSCGCFGAALEAKVSWLTVLRTSALALLGGYVFLTLGPRRNQTPRDPTADGTANAARAADGASS